MTGETKAPKPKALGITEKKQLKELVDNDFSVLRQEMDQLTAELVALRHTEIDEEFADRQADLDQARTEWNELTNNIRTQVQEFRARCREQGVVISPDRRYGSELLTIGTPDFTLPAKKEAKERVEQEVNLQIRRAKTGLERQRIDAHRKILVSGLAEEATAILSSMPDPRRLVLDAVSQTRDDRLALLAGAPAPAQVVVNPEAAEVVEGLVIGRVENMADRGGRIG